MTKIPQQSELEAALDYHLRISGLPLQPVRQFQFAKDIGRRWRFDVAFPDYLIALEANGGIWAQGRHTRGSGHRGDVEKLNEAQVRGWIVLQFTKDMLWHGDFLPILKRALKAHGWIEQEAAA